MDSHYFPRNIMIDSEPDIVNNIRNSKHASRYRPDYLISGQQSCQNNCAKGYHTIGKQLIDDITDKIRILADACDHMQGFVLNHSVGGGTGSGVAALILETLSDDYKKRIKLGYDIYNDNTSVCPVEPYNALFSNYYLLNHTDMSYTFDNTQALRLCNHYLHIPRANLMNVNRLLTKIVSATTLSYRREGHIGDTMQARVDKLVPFPQIHFMMSSFA
eukprot:969503_1